MRKTNASGTKKASVFCEKMTYKELKPGDLFSLHGEDYWNVAIDGPLASGYLKIRTNYPIRESEALIPVYRVEIRKA